MSKKQQFWDYLVTSQCSLRVKIVEIEKLPREILEKAVRLRDAHRNIYIILYTLGKPSTAKEVADQVDKARPYVHMRLIELCERGLVKSHRQGRTVKFEIVQEKVEKHEEDKS